MTLTWSGNHVSKVEDSSGREVNYDYDGSGNLTSIEGVDSTVANYSYGPAHFIDFITSPVGGQTVNVRNPNGKIQSQTDPNGGLTDFAYGDGITTVTHPDGAVTIDKFAGSLLVSQTDAYGTSLATTTKYKYDDRANIIAETDGLGHQSTMTYDANGNLTSQTDALGHTTTYSYNAFGDLLSVEDPLGRETTSTYDSAGNRLTTETPGGHTTQWTYNSDGTVHTVTDARGKVTSYEYDSAGNPVATSDPDGHSSTITLDAHGNIASSTDSGGKTTTFTTDLAGRVLTATDPESHITTWEYDSDGNVTSLEDADGHTVTRTYNGSDQVSTETDARGKTTSFNYSFNGDIDTVTDPNGHTSTNTYNKLGQLASSKDANNNETTYTYDLAGNALSATSPLGKVNSATYDAADRKITATDGNGAITHFAYNAANELTSTTDTLDRTTQQSFTLDGLLDTVALADASTQDYDYNATGQLTDFKNADGKHTTYSYDNAGLLTSKTEPGAMTTAFDYNSRGLLHQTTKPDASTSTLTYDNAGLLTNIHSSAAGSTDTQFEYTPAGQRTKMTDASGTSSYSYNANGQLSSQTNGAGTTIGYTYDDAGQLATLTYPGSRTVTYAYDPAGQMTSLTDWASHTTAFDWNNDAQLSSQEDPNGITQTRTYDDAGQTTAITTASSTATIASFTYGYDSSGAINATSTTDPISTTASARNYSYDDLGQLTTVDNGATSSSYAATPAGAVTATATGSALTYNASQQLTGLTPATGPANSYAYDGSGARVSNTTAAHLSVPASTATYGYDPLGSLHSVAIPSSASTPAVNISYTSDGDGLRQTRTQGTESNAFLWSTAGSLPLLLDDGDHSYLYGPSSSPIAQVDDGTGAIQYLHPDLIGSVRLITSSTGSTIATNRYDAYGNLEDHSGPGSSAIGYSGNWTDAVTGLVYLRARDYDPVTAQFLTVDPAVDSTRQPYAYVANNPLLLTDPTGLDFWGDVRNNGLAFGAGVLDGATGGISSAILSATVPGYECLVKDNGFFTAGSVTGTVGSILLSGGAGAVLVVGRVAARVAIDVAARGVRRLATAGIERLAEKVGERGLGAAVRTGTEDAAKSCLNSFTADTPVTMADGTKKRIEDVRVGDRVLATDPETGESGPRPVVALIRHSGEHTMVKLTLADGSKINTTDHHPFWDASSGTFVYAVDLRVGARVLDSSGREIAVQSRRVYERDLTAYNLEIDGIHTYFVGDTPVLVHNSCGYPSFSAAKRGLGSPGAGNVYDHIVEQSQIARSGLAKEVIHSADNLNPVPAIVNQIKANLYSRNVAGPGSGTVRDFLSRRSYEFQHEYGLRITKQIMGELGL